MKLLIKILSVFVIIICLIIGAGFYGLFYTALPAKFAFNMLEKADHKWDFENISGSLSKGFNIGAITYIRPEDPSKISTIKNIGFEYEKSSDAIVITQLHLDSAYLYINPKADHGNFSYQSTTSSDDTDNQSDLNNNGNTIKNTDKNSFPKKWLSKKWIIKNIGIKDLTIEDPTTNEKTYIKKIQSDGFMIVNGKLLFGKLAIASNNLDLTINPMGDLNDDNMGSVAKVEGRVGKKLYWMLKQDINFSGSVDLNTFPGTISSFKGLNDSITMIKETDERQKLVFNDFSFNDYIENESLPPFKNLNLEAVYHIKNQEKVALEIVKGDFILGNSLFTIKQARIDLTDQSSQANKVTALSSSDGTDYTITITDDGEMKFDFSSKPSMTQDEILAKLIYRENFNTLDEKQKSDIENYSR